MQKKKVVKMSNFWDDPPSPVVKIHNFFFLMNPSLINLKIRETFIQSCQCSIMSLIQSPIFVNLVFRYFNFLQNFINCQIGSLQHWSINLCYMNARIMNGFCSIFCLNETNVRESNINPTTESNIIKLKWDSEVWGYVRGIFLGDDIPGWSTTEAKSMF